MRFFHSPKNDQLISEIYNTSWAKLPIPEQKMLQLLLFHAQNHVVFTDGFTPIDLETFMEVSENVLKSLILFKIISFQIIKKIYSYFTVLRNFN